MTDETHTDGTDESSGVSRREVLRGAGLAALASAPALASSAGTAKGAVAGGPNGVHIAYGADPKTSMAIGWTGGPAGDALVRFGDPGDLDTTVRADRAPVPGMDAFAYTARLTGLSSGTEYAYEVAMDGTTRGPFTFQTAPDADQPFRVTAVGDHGIADPNNPGQRPSTDDPNAVVSTVADLLDGAAEEGRYPGFHIGVGDISYSNGAPSTWERYFSEFEDLYAERPFMTTPGNHEAEPGTGLLNYDRRLNDLMPIFEERVSAEHEQRWYDFDFGNTKFVSMNTTTDNCGDILRAEEYIPLYDPRCSDPEGTGLVEETYGEVQEAFLREALEDAAENPDIQWTVVFMHGPLWTTSPDHAPRFGLREKWGRIFDEYGVDLVLHGDNHLWERSQPIEDNPNSEPGEFGTTFLVNGTGGVSHYATGPDAEFLEFQTNEHFGPTLLDIDEESITVEYVVASSPNGAELGEVRDRFDIVKDAQGRPTQVDRRDELGGTEDPTPDPFTLDVSGTRTDDGTAFLAGDTNQIGLSVDANTDVTALRDTIPVEWDVVGGDASRTEAGPEGTQYVYFEDVDPDQQQSVTYFVEAPRNPAQSGEYAFGPCEVHVNELGTFRPAPGTTSDEVVVGFDDGSFGL